MEAGQGQDQGIRDLVKLQRGLEWGVGKRKEVSLFPDPEWERGERREPWAKAVTQKTRAEVKTDAKQKLSISGGTWGLP